MSAIRKGLQNERGFTLIEVTIILLVLVILSTIMLPQLGNFNRLARFVVVKEDLGAICASMKKMLDEVMLGAPFGKPGGTIAPPRQPIGVLYGPGPVPASPNIGQTYNCRARNIWTLDAGDDFRCQTDSRRNSSRVGFTADLLQYHLQVNDPLGGGPSPRHGGGPGGGRPDPGKRYKNVIDDPLVPFPFGWSGPYFNEINTDPWGSRYSVNTFGLHSGTADPYTHDDVFMTPVICISWGPNKDVDTEGNMPGDWTRNGAPDYLIGGDDIAAMLSAGGPF